VPQPRCLVRCNTSLTPILRITSGCAAGRSVRLQPRCATARPASLACGISTPDNRDSMICDWHLQIDVRRRIATPSRKFTGGTTIERSPAPSPSGATRLTLYLRKVPHPQTTAKFASSSFLPKPAANRNRILCALFDVFPYGGWTGIVGIRLSSRGPLSGVARNQVGADYLY